MIAVRVVQGTRVLAEVNLEASAEGATIEIADRPVLESPAAPPLPPPPRTWPAGLAWTALGVAGAAATTLVAPSFWSPWNHARASGLALSTLSMAIGLPTVAGGLFLVLKVAGRRVRMVDVLRTLGLLVWLIPAIDAASLAAYYPLSPAQFGLFQGALVALILPSIVATIAGIRREPRSLGVTAAWAACTLAFLLGVSTLGRMSGEERGQPTFDLVLYPPIAGYAGKAESLDEYLASIRAAADSSLETAAAPTRSAEAR
jgi:hypothetical protein